MRARLQARACVVAALALVSCACAAMSRPPEAGQPRTEPTYVALGASDERRERTLATWATLVRGQTTTTAPPAPELQPITSTIRALPVGAPDSLRLPKVGGTGGWGQTEEELRESLRRFVAQAGALLGVASDDLSLVKRTDNPDGTHRAVYQQTPFLYPLRGGFGRLDITFTPDLRVTALSSTAIPDAERLRRPVANLRPTITAADAAARLAGRTITYTDDSGAPRTFAVNSAGDANARRLVVYPVRPAEDANLLALHLAWEVALGGTTPAALVYLDALTGDTLAAHTASPETEEK